MSRSKWPKNHIPGNAKVTPETVFKIRQEYEEGATQRELGDKYGLTTQQIGRIVRGDSWKQFARPLTPEEIEAAARRLDAPEEGAVFMSPDFLDKSAKGPPTNLDDPNLPDSGLNAVDEFLKKRGEKPL